MTDAVTIRGGFAEITAGAWLMSSAQPVAFFGDIVRRPRKGWFLRDGSSLDLIETRGRVWCADASRPFLTQIPCAAPVNAVSGKVLVAPASARTGAELVKIIPMSARSALCTTFFGKDWVVMATASRTTRISVADGETLAVRPEAVIAWTGKRPTGFVRRLGIWDILLPRTPRDLMLHFHGPCIVWLEGANCQTGKLSNRQSFRRAYGI